MVLLVGNNASGKTKFLYDMAMKNPDSCVTNLPGVTNKPLRINKESALSLQYKLWEGDILPGDSSITISEAAFSEEFFRLLSLIFAEAEYLLLDEPDAKLASVREGNIIFDALCRTSRNRDCIYVATHDESYLGISDAKAYIVKDGNLVYVGDEWYEYIV